jgi:hypothetical protein
MSAFLLATGIAVAATAAVARLPMQDVTRAKLRTLFCDLQRLLARQQIVTTRTGETCGRLLQYTLRTEVQLLSIPRGNP